MVFFNTKKPYLSLILPLIKIVLDTYKKYLALRGCLNFTIKYHIMARKHKQNRKNRSGVVFSTNPDFEYEYEQDEVQETLPAADQKLKVSLDRKRRKGKTVTLIEGFVGTEEDLKSLGKLLKSKCGVGGSAKDGEIIVQGDCKLKVIGLLKDMGYSKTR